MSRGDLGLLGVGGGVTRPDWVGVSRTAKKQPQGAPAQVATPVATPLASSDPFDTSVRDQRLVTEAVQRLSVMVEGFSESYNMPSVAANSTVTFDIALTTTDKVRAGDYVAWGGGDTLTHGIINQGGGPIPSPANDTVRIRVSNVTASAIDPGAMTHYFTVLRSIEQE